MSALSRILRSVEGGRIMFRCPGCEAAGRGWAHVVTVDPPPGYSGPVWGYNGNAEAPTITPSILATGRYPKGHDSRNPAPHGWAGEYEKTVCHSFVTDGRIQYLGDCTHALAGQTVEIPPWNGEGE